MTDNPHTTPEATPPADAPDFWPPPIQLAALPPPTSPAVAPAQPTPLPPTFPGGPPVGIAQPVVFVQPRPRSRFAYLKLRLIILLAFVLLVAMGGLTSLLMSRLAGPPSNLPTQPVYPPPARYSPPDISYPPLTMPSLDWPSTYGTPTKTGKRGSYKLEREKLTATESAYYGGLRQGSCVNNPPDDLSVGHVATVPCSKRHTDQVAGFVDLTSGMPDVNDEDAFGFEVDDRCIALKETLPIPANMTSNISFNFPDAPGWDTGVRVALCWVPGYDKPWLGSVIDGTARQG